MNGNGSVNLVVRAVPLGESLTLPHDLFVAAGFVGSDPWLRVSERLYGFSALKLVVEDRSGPKGLLALVDVKHPIFGHFLTTAPFASYGGFAYTTLAARDALLRRACDLMNEERADYVCVRFDRVESPPPERWTETPTYATYNVDLQPSADALLAGYSSDHRNHIRRSLKKGFTISFGHMELLRDAYEALARSMHELGSPYHGRQYLRQMASLLGSTLEFAVVRDAAGKLAGAAVFISHEDRVTNLHANILRAYRGDYAGEFLYWSAILHYREAGFRILDLGRSLIGSGNEAFKNKWKPRKQVLSYWYHMAAGHHVPELNQQNPKFQLAIWLWKHLPAFVVRPLGPALIRGLA